MKNINDMKHSKTWAKFDDNLFGIIYKELKWDIVCSCPYYKEWCNIWHMKNIIGKTSNLKNHIGIELAIVYIVIKKCLQLQNSNISECQFVDKFLLNWMNF